MMRWYLVVALLLGTSSCVRRTPEPELPPAAPPEKKAPVVIDVPRREGAPTAIVMPVDVRGAPLLTSDAARLRRWAARHIALQTQVPLDVVPLEDLARFAELASKRRLTAEGPVCAGSVPLEVTLKKNYPEAVRVRPIAECSDTGCRFSVAVLRRDAPATAFSAAVPKPHLFEQWEAAAQALTPGEVPPPPALPTEVVSNTGFAPEEVADVVRVQAFDDWNASPDLKALEEWDFVFEQCHEPGQPVRPADTVVLEVAELGKVTACAAFGSAEAPAHVLDCYCRGFKDATFGEGADRRRLAITVQDRPEYSAYTEDRGRVSSTISAFASSDAAIDSNAFTGVLPWAGLCYGNTRLRERLELDVKLEVGLQGNITAADLNHPSAPKTLTSCIESYLRNVTLPCTLSGGAAQVAFTLSIEKHAPATISRLIQ